MQKIWVLALACLFMFTACDYVATDADSLLYAPTVNKQQGEVYAAVERLNLGEITPKYPQGGDHRSPYVFFDLDGDGRNEAIFFYSYTSTRASTRAMILRQDAAGEWIHVRDIPTGYAQIDFVQFAHMLSESAACMIVGWQNVAPQSGQVSESAIGVYSMANGDVISEIVDQSYLARIVYDFDGDALDEMVLVDRDPRRQRFTASFLCSIGPRIGVASTVELNAQIDALAGNGALAVGKLWNGAAAVYIDERRMDGVYATEILEVGDSALKILAGGNEVSTLEKTVDEWENYAGTYRENAALSRDYDGDGEVEVPGEQQQLPGTLQDGERDPLMLTVFQRLSEDGMVQDSSAVVNNKEGYLFFMPEIWSGWVSVVRAEDDALWRFYLLDSETSDPNIELLRIEAVGEPGEPAGATGRIPLGSLGSRYFFGYIPLRTSDTPTITESELKESFRILQ